MMRSIDGMESIVASVSGHHGTERFKLIKLISHAGANYVGTMSRSTTHLFCWKFEGKKYDLAKKFGTIIVNHQWLEDSIKAGKRIPENSYTFLSGDEVGPITMELPAVSGETPATTGNDLPFVKSDGHTGAIDLDCEEAEDGFHHQDLFLDENLFGQPRESLNDQCRTRNKKKLDEYFLKQNSMENSTARSYHPQRSASRKLQQEESTCAMFKSQVMLKTVNSHDTKCKSEAEASRRKRRLVKKNAERNLIDCDELECGPLEKEFRNSVTRPSGHLYNINCQKKANTSSISEYASSDHRGTCDEEVIEVELARDRKGTNGHHKSCLNGEQSPNPGDKTLPDIFADIEKLKGKLEGETIDCFARSSPVEVSCAICWTDYSSTRGILLCGHRFCFSCIQRWADRSVSSGKQTKCPMCAENFSSIIKVDATDCLDQKVYSQTIPCDPSTRGVFIVPDVERRHFASHATLEPLCIQCQSREPEDLLMPCRFCQIQCVHSYCLDPPLFPWTCNGCRDLQIFRHHI